MNRGLLTDVARKVVEAVDQRKFDANRPFNENLFSLLCCHELLVQRPELQSRLWMGYQPWPEESDECIGCWIAGDEQQRPQAIEIHVDDPADDSVFEVRGVWDQIISDVLRLATAIQHCGLGSGYILLFGELRQDPRDQRVAHFPAENINEVVMVKTDALQSATVMDAGFSKNSCTLVRRLLMPSSFNCSLAIHLRGRILVVAD